MAREKDNQQREKENQQSTDCLRTYSHPQKRCAGAHRPTLRSDSPGHQWSRDGRRAQPCNGAHCHHEHSGRCSRGGRG